MWRECTATALRTPLIKTILLLLACLIGMAGGARAQVWTVVAFDPKGDGRDAALADAAQLSYRYDQPQDMLWFRVSLYGKANADSFGVNIVVDTGATDAAKMNWWGANKDFQFDKLLTAWVTKKNGAYVGTIGVGDAAGAKARNVNNLLKNNLQLRVESDSILIGVKRTDLTDKMKFKLIAAVGSAVPSGVTSNDQWNNGQWNDDMPNAGSVTLDLSAPRPTRGLRELDLARNNFRLPSTSKTLPDDQPPSIVREGRGRQALILVPGVYSGNQVFSGFIARNLSQYAFYVVTPPGLNGTAPRSLPPETISYGEFTWTRRLGRDILELISREKLRRPVIVTHGFPGSLAAHELASRHPELIGGVIDIAVMPVQFFPSFKEPGRKTGATPEERIAIVNEAWAEKWFKYVTPETWESNNYVAAMFTEDPARGEQVRQQVEAAPLPVKIRYLTEFMASDDRSELAALTVPLLALRPGFNEKFLADPAHAFYKIGFQDSWEAFSANAHIKLLTIPNARALILDDQPQLADDAIAAFIQEISRANMARE
jgi:pimeloyl-ACP methyl ester carboxylesterase